VASVFAACANSISIPFGFTVDELWTFGAPGVSKTPLVNQQSSSQSAVEGCFNGGRFWNQDSLYVDPIPGLSRALFFKHPHISSTRIKDTNCKDTGGTCATGACHASRGDTECTILKKCYCKDGFCAQAGACVQHAKGGFEIEEFACGSAGTHTIPEITAAVQGPLLHLMSEYIGRCRYYWTGSSFSSPLVSDTATASPTAVDAGCTLSINYTSAVNIASNTNKLPPDGLASDASSSGAAQVAAFLVLAMADACLFPRQRDSQ